MTAEPVTVAPGSSVALAAHLAREYGIRHLLVVDGERPVGMVQLDDALREFAPVGLGF
jgi:CBS domain-containing protein